MIGVQDLLKEFDSVEYVTGIGTTPARVHRPTRTIQINKPVWDAMPPEHQVFVLCHELGHAELNTSDEFAVDKYASAMYTRLGYSLSESVRALTDLLNNDNPIHQERAQAQLDRAREHDYAVNGNKKVYEPEYVHPGNPRRHEKSCRQYDNCDGCTGCNAKKQTAPLFDSLTGGRFDTDKNAAFFKALEHNNADTIPVRIQVLEYNNADGDTGDSHAMPMFKCEKGEKARHCRIRMRAESRAYMRMSRGMKMQDKGQQFIQKGNAEELLAAQGIAKKSGAEQAAGVIGAVGDAAGKVVGAWKGTGYQPGGDGPNGGIQVKSGNMTMYIGFGAAAVVGLILILLIKK